jgi:glycosyltransferase involved in cell wall biosynthesis
VPRLPRRRPLELQVAVPDAILEVARHGATALRPGDADASRLHVAAVVPSFRRGSGGHTTIARLLRGLEARGHACSVWIDDLDGRHATETDVQTEETFTRFFGGVAGPVRRGFDAWAGADVVLATGWQTVHRALRLDGCAARAYLVQDHEPEFYGTSAERTWAAETYRLGLHCLCASPWLAGLVAARYGAATSTFDLGVDHEAYRPLAVQRRDDLVLFYARPTTARRAAPLGLLALQELHRRRPAVKIALFGEAGSFPAAFPHAALGTLDEAALARAYNGAAVGLVLSLTNPSLVPTEMLACGLPVVDVASESMVATFGEEGPIRLAQPDPMALAAAMEDALDDPEDRARRMRDGLALAETRTWEGSGAQVEEGLREALRAGAT